MRRVFLRPPGKCNDSRVFAREGGKSANDAVFPVIDEEGVLVGMISKTDLVREAAEENAHE